MKKKRKNIEIFHSVTSSKTYASFVAHQNDGSSSIVEPKTLEYKFFKKLKEDSHQAALSQRFYQNDNFKCPLATSHVGGLYGIAQSKADASGLTLPDGKATNLCSKVPSLYGQVTFSRTKNQTVCGSTFSYKRQKLFHLAAKVLSLDHDVFPSMRDDIISEFLQRLGIGTSIKSHNSNYGVVPSRSDIPHVELDNIREVFLDQSEKLDSFYTFQEPISRRESEASLSSTCSIFEDPHFLIEGKAVFQIKDDSSSNESPLFKQDRSHINFSQMFKTENHEDPNETYYSPVPLLTDTSLISDDFSLTKEKNCRNKACRTGHSVVDMVSSKFIHHTDINSPCKSQSLSSLREPGNSFVIGEPSFSTKPCTFRFLGQSDCQMNGWVEPRIPLHDITFSFDPSLFIESLLNNQSRKLIRNSNELPLCPSPPTPFCPVEFSLSQIIDMDHYLMNEGIISEENTS